MFDQADDDVPISISVCSKGSKSFSKERFFKLDERPNCLASPPNTNTNWLKTARSMGTPR